MKPTLSLILVVSEADEELEATLGTYLETTRRLPYASELVVVIDGVAGPTAETARRVLEGSKTNSKLLQIHRMAGESIAISAACRESNGDVLVLLPSYIQVDPGDIETMVKEVDSGRLDYVASWRDPRVDADSAARKSRLFNWLTRKASGVHLHDINSGLRALKRQIFDDVAIYADLHRFLPILSAMQGYRVGEVRVRHVKERVKKGDYRLGVYLRRLLDLLTLFFLRKFTRKPLRFFGLLGSGVLAVGALLLLVAVVERLFGGVALSNRPVLVFSVMMVVLGAQLFSFGLLGELVIFAHARDIAEYKVEKVLETSAR